MISFVRGAQVLVYVFDVFITFNCKLSDKMINSAVTGRNVITAAKGGSEIRIIMVTCTKFNIS